MIFKKRADANKKNILQISRDQVLDALKKIPEKDFIDGQYDLETSSQLKKIIFILSTPRCGSTLLSGLFYRNGFCLPHEYFQKFQYMPILADRWGCIHGEILDKQAYLDNLIKKRTSPKGWLGINLHGEHLATFSHFENLMPEVEMQFIHLIRKDSIAQAVSYELAMQSGKWSSHFAETDKASYSFSGIKARLDAISQQNTLISAYLKSRKFKGEIVFYEDLARDPVAKLKELFPDTMPEALNLESGLARQSSATNKEWIERFAGEYAEMLGQG